MQIGKRVTRLENAQLAMERQNKKAQHKTGVSTDDNMELNLDVRYQISNSRNDPVNLYTFVRKNREDPAFSVSLSFEI